MKLHRLASRSRIPEGDLGEGGQERPRRPRVGKLESDPPLSVEPVLLARLGWHGKRQMSQDAAWLLEGCSPHLHHRSPTFF